MGKDQNKTLEIDHNHNHSLKSYFEPKFQKELDFLVFWWFWWNSLRQNDKNWHFLVWYDKLSSAWHLGPFSSKWVALCSLELKISSKKAKNVNFLQKLGHLLKIGRSDNVLTTLKVFSASKIAYLGVWLMFQFNMVEPTLKKWETCMFVAISCDTLDRPSVNDCEPI